MIQSRCRIGCLSRAQILRLNRNRLDIDKDPDHPARYRISETAGFLAGGSTPPPAFPGHAQWPGGARLLADSCGGSYGSVRWETRRFIFPFTPPARDRFEGGD